MTAIARLRSWATRHLTGLDLLVGIALALGLVMRIQVATSYGIFLDEGLNYPLSLTFIQSLAHAPFDPAGFSADPLKPQFFRLAYGPSTWAAFGFGAVPARQLLYNEVLPTSGLTAGRLFAAILDTVLAGATYAYVRKSAPTLAVLLAAFVFLNPVGTFWETVMYTHYLFIPLTVLLLLVLARPREGPNSGDLLAGALFGLLLSVQYYALIFLLLPLVADWTAHRSEPGVPFVDRIARLLQVYGIFLAVAGVVFYALNPLFWTEPITAFQSIVDSQFLSQGNTLTTSSGVAGVPTYFGGSSHLVTPWYFPVEIFTVETPTILLVLTPLGIVAAVRAIRRRASTFPDRLALLAAVALVSELTFSAPIQHFHSWADINLYLGPTAVLAAVGALGLLAWVASRWANSTPAPRTTPTRSSARWSPAPTRRPTILLATLVGILAISTALEVGAGPSYTNLFADLSGRSGSNLVGAYGSPQADGLMGHYLGAVGISNATVLTLGFTVSVDYYSPPERFIQLWQTVATTSLEQTYRGDFVVLDAWYVQLWGDPIPNGDRNFSLLHQINVTGGFSQLYRILPLVASVSPIYAAQVQQIQINGTDLGEAPQVLPAGGDGFVDTVLSPTTPSLAVSVSAPNGSFLWEAGLSTPNGSDAIGVSILSWSDSQVLLGGFSPNVVVTGSPGADPRAFTLSPGDLVGITVHAPHSSGTTTWNTVVETGPSFTVLDGATDLPARSTATIHLTGTGFGRGPVLVPLSGGYSDTEVGADAPIVALDVFGPTGAFLWEAGLASASGRDAVGFQVVSWNSTEIVLLGLGPNYFTGNGPVPTGMYALDPGDLAIWQVTGPGGGASVDAQLVAT